MNSISGTYFRNILFNHLVTQVFYAQNEENKNTYFLRHCEEKLCYPVYKEICKKVHLIVEWFCSPGENVVVRREVLLIIAPSMPSTVLGTM